MYPKYHPSGEIDKDVMKNINRKIKDLFTSKLGEVIVNSADTIVISAFLGLTMLAMYNNYYYILTAVMGFVTLFFKASTAGIGNSLVIESQEKNYGDLNKFTFLVSWIGLFCGCCLLCLYQPFMELWVGKDYMLELGCVVCFSVYFYIRVMNQVLIVYKDAAGMWHEDRFRPLCTALTNLILNLLLVQIMGIYGVLLSTVFSTLFVGMPWVIKNLFSVVLKQNPLGYVKKLMQYVLVAGCSWLITYFVCTRIAGNLMLILIARLIICLIIPNIIYIAVFHNRDEFKQTIKLVDNVLGRKIKPLHNVLEKIYH